MTSDGRRVPFGSSRACPVCGGPLNWSKSGFWWCSCGWESETEKRETDDVS